MYIAFFDSGVGGLTVLEEARKLLPNENYIYFADSENVPYGTRSNEEISSLVKDAVKFISSHKLKALVLACNTATSVVVKELRSNYQFPIIGMEPAIKPAVEIGTKKVLLCATERTLKEEKLLHLIKDLKASARVKLMSLQSLVTFAEHFDFYSDELINYLSDQFKLINWNEFDGIVLGCTHFLFFKSMLRNIIPAHVQILDGNNGTVNRLSSLITKSKEKTSKPILYYRSKEVMPSVYFDNYLRLAEEQ